ncbi:GntR family transcriptional regulator [Denitrobaculum tricleocarpae]|uniref:GntR family transcriptional regulator n=1 Tax=Denitrobaculum tricleocarpae TaxID=2591009 RepID=A0A545SSY2_9PROT|nr:GntR family transcriptional regulator [Denitrobaculum tricleocarpae]TQV68074.1 GntR family transcriptional regulator [Denitrobaculum tricleocarpae]
MSTKAANHIVETVENEIVFGQLRPGELLHQVALAERFGVSRQPVRTALEILTEKKLLTRRADRSLEVRGLPRSAPQEILAIRRTLEPQALSQAFNHLTERDLLLAQQALELFEIETETQHLAQRDIDFHLALYRPCNSATLIRLITELRRTNIRAYLGQPLGSKARQTCIEEHHAILKACKSGNREAALSLLITHLDIAQERFE